MDNGVMVRSMEELREHFSLAHVLRYIENGKLSKWLRDRYEDGIADQIDSLDPDDSELAKKVSEIFDVSCDADIESKKALVFKHQLIGMAPGCLDRIDGILLKR